MIWSRRPGRARCRPACRSVTSCSGCHSRRSGWRRQGLRPSRSNRPSIRPVTWAPPPDSSTPRSPRTRPPRSRLTGMDDAMRAQQGMAVRREVLGDEHVDRAVAGTTAFTEPFQEFITRYAWGDIWSRPGLTRAERSLVTLAVLTALQHEGELGMHVKAALRNGLTPEQIQEVLLQVAVYAGVPAGNRAFAVAQRALQEVQRALQEVPQEALPEQQSRPGAPPGAPPGACPGTSPDAPAEQ